MKRMAFFVLVGILFMPGRASAFSVGPGFFVLSNYELVKQADAIVLAKAIKSNPEDRRVQFRIIERLKGNCKEKSVSAYEGYVEFYGRSEKGDFTHARPGTYRGMGTALDYRIGQYYLLFLTNVKGQWCVGRQALSRTQEEIDPEDSPWLVVVRHYIKIAQLKDYERERAALWRLWAKAESGTDPQTYPPGLVIDIDRHFSRPSPMKSYADLMPFYSSAQTKREKGKALYAIAKAGHEEALPMVRHLIADVEMCNIFLDYLVKLKDRSAVENIANHFINVDWCGERWADALVELADANHTKTMLRAFESHKGQGVRRILLPWFNDYPSLEAVDALRRAVGSDFENQEKWYLTLQLASLGDEDVVQWAFEKLEKAGAVKSTELLHIITHSPTQKANEIVRELIANSNQRTLLTLFYALITDSNHNAHRWGHVEAIVRLENKSDSLIHEMKDSLKRRKNDRARSLLEMLER